jgi:hypothetical protein
VQPTVTAAIDFQIFPQPIFDTLVGRVHFFEAEIKQAVDFNELDSIGVVHLKSGGQIARDIPVLGPFHPQVYFIQHDDVRILEFSKLRFGGRKLFDRRFGAIQLPAESLGTAKAGLDQLEIQTAFDVPESRANNRPKGSLNGPVRLNAFRARRILDDGRAEKVVETLG